MNIPKGENFGIIVKQLGSKTGEHLYCGEFEGCDRKFLYIKITDGFEELEFIYKDQGQLFDITFTINRLS